jgi:hypothetical protein
MKLKRGLNSGNAFFHFRILYLYKSYQKVKKLDCITPYVCMCDMKEIKMLILFSGFEPRDNGLFYQSFRAVAVFVFMVRVDMERMCWLH